MNLIHPRTWQRVQHRGRLRRIAVGTFMFIGIEQCMQYGITKTESHPVNWTAASVLTGTMWGIATARVRIGLGYGCLFGILTMPLYLWAASGDLNRRILYGLERYAGIKEAGQMAHQLEEEMEAKQKKLEEDQHIRELEKRAKKEKKHH